MEHSLRVLRALVTADPRAFEIRVPGPSALLVAKVHKIADRSQEPEGKRVNDKDGLDVLRLLRVIPSRELAAGLMRLQRETVPAEVTLEAIAQLDVLFGSTRSIGTQMAVRATERLEDPVIIAESCEALAREVLDLLRA